MIPAVTILTLLPFPNLFFLFQTKILEGTRNNTGGLTKDFL